jgi:predicted HicB family RNase H-like nuclease
MSKTMFKKPGELFKEKEKTVTLSTRVLESAKATLERAAAREGKSVAALAGRIIEEYAAWLREQEEKKR